VQAIRTTSAVPRGQACPAGATTMAHGACKGNADQWHGETDHRHRTPRMAEARRSARRCRSLTATLMSARGLLSRKGADGSVLLDCPQRVGSRRLVGRLRLTHRHDMSDFCRGLIAGRSAYGGPAGVTGLSRVWWLIADRGLVANRTVNRDQQAAAARCGGRRVRRFNKKRELMKRRSHGFERDGDFLWSHRTC